MNGLPVKRHLLTNACGDVAPACYCFSGLTEWEMPLDELFDTQDHDGDEMEFKNHFIAYLRDNNFIDTTAKPGRKKKEIELAEETLERFFNEEE
jgi:hypothetical protein